MITTIHSHSTVRPPPSPLHGHVQSHVSPGKHMAGPQHTAQPLLPNSGKFRYFYSKVAEFFFCRESWKQFRYNICPKIVVESNGKNKVNK